MKALSESTITNKKVLLRCDFNVTYKDGTIIDDSKIQKSLETIKHLLDNNNKVIIFSHLGRVKTEEDKANNSLAIVYEYLKDYIELEFINNPLDLSKVTDVTNCNCFLVENTRWTDVPEKKESVNDLDLAKYWASFGDVFVIDAFASLHRAHSSTAGISKYLPTYYGFLVEKELNNLEPLVNNELHPFIVIMGGAKVDDKIKIIESILKKCDKLILTGGILNTFLKVSGKNVGQSLVSKEEDVLESVRRVLNNNKEKLFFGDKFVIKRNGEILTVSLKDIQDGDIIYDNIPNLLDILNDGKIIFYNGTCGKYEEKEYEFGTLQLLKDLNDTSASVFIGGGDTVGATIKFGYKDSFKYLSSGGGATLEYVAFGSLKALDWIKENGVEN